MGGYGLTCVTIHQYRYHLKYLGPRNSITKGGKIGLWRFFEKPMGLLINQIGF